MPNLYDIGTSPVTGRVSWEAAVHEALERADFKPYGLRPTNTGLVVKPSGEVVPMRWGFRRPHSNSMNLARGDNLEKGVWAKAFRERRCLAVVNCFHEFDGPKGRKQAHAFQRPDGGWMWFAGFWEDSSELGPCYAVITTPANAFMEPIHPRMPAVLDDAAAAESLNGGFEPRDFEQPPAPELVTFPCGNPLRIKDFGPPVPVQRDLFGGL
jgi:putative SOS response-associated peptidase YedK